MVRLFWFYSFVNFAVPVVLIARWKGGLLCLPLFATVVMVWVFYRSFTLGQLLSYITGLPRIWLGRVKVTYSSPSIRGCVETRKGSSECSMLLGSEHHPGVTLGHSRPLEGPETRVFSCHLKLKPLSSSRIVHTSQDFHLLNFPAPLLHKIFTFRAFRPRHLARNMIIWKLSEFHLR